MAGYLQHVGRLEFTQDTLRLTVSRVQIEAKLGTLLQQLQQAVDQYFPHRITDIPLTIVDNEDRYCLKFKIWHTIQSYS